MTHDKKKTPDNESFIIDVGPLENVVSEMASILSRPQCVKAIHLFYTFTWRRIASVNNEDNAWLTTAVQTSGMASTI